MTFYYGEGLGDAIDYDDELFLLLMAHYRVFTLDMPNFHCGLFVTVVEYASDTTHYLSNFHRVLECEFWGTQGRWL